MRNGLRMWRGALRNRFALAPGDLLRDAAYRRLWTSILISSLGGQVTMLALPLTAAVLLHATPTICSEIFGVMQSFLNVFEFFYG